MGKYVYLRPTEDVSLQHTCSSGSSGYAMIDEEEADNESTYIGYSTSSTSSTTKTSTFKLTGNIPTIENGVIESAKLVIVHYKSTSGTYSGSVTVSNEAANTLTFKSVSWETQEFDITNLDLFQFGDNNVNVTFSTSINSSSSRKTAEVRCTQIYIAVYYTAYYNINTSLKLGHGVTFDNTKKVEWESADISKFQLEENKHLLRVLDNNIDVTSQIKYVEPSASYTVEAIDGVTYGFTLDDTGTYYVSQNAGQSSSFSLCKVNFNCSGSCKVNLYVINYAEATYDYGIVGNLGETLTSSNTADSNYMWIGNTSAKNISTEQTISFDLAEDNFIYIKYRKDSGTDSNNDSLQFRVEMIQESTDPYYGYTLENITTGHEIILYTELPFIKKNGTFKEAKTIYLKINGAWVEQTDICKVFDSLKNYEKAK